MNHKGRKDSYKRSTGRAKPPKQFILYVEGRNTEKSYFMLHFYNHSGNAIPMVGDSHSYTQIKEINKFIKKYNKNAALPIAEYSIGSKKVEEDFFDLMMAYDKESKKSRIVLASERAKAIHENKKANGSESKESVTTIYELLLELGVIEKNKDGYMLFRK